MRLGRRRRGIRQILETEPLAREAGICAPVSRSLSAHDIVTEKLMPIRIG